MKKKILLIILYLSCFIFLCLVVFAYLFVESKMDTYYAIKYAEVFGGFDIDRVDRYLSEDTLIIYNDKADTYKNLRGNVISAFEDKKYRMSNSYGSSMDEDFDLKKTRNVGIMAYAKSDLYDSDYVEIELERRWLFFHKITAMTSQDTLFGYIFYGEAAEDEKQNYLAELFDAAEVRTDVDPVASMITWIDIDECKWKCVTFDDDRIPGPTDILVCGYITPADNDFFSKMQTDYEWENSKHNIEMLPDGMKKDDVRLMSSAGYDKAYISYQNDSQIKLYIDFDNMLIYFAGTF